MRPHRLMQMHFKSKFRAKLLQFRNPRLGAMPKAKIAALVQRTQPQPVHQNRPHKLPRRPPRQLRIEPQHHHRVDPCPLKQPQPFVQRREQLWRFLRPKKMFRVRIERDRHGTHPLRARLIQHRRKNPRMPSMNAVEVPDRAHRWPNPAGISQTDL